MVEFRILAVVWAAALLLFTLNASAQTSASQAYPSKPLRFVLSFPPGGATDAVGRTVSDRLQEGLKQNVVIDYRPGAGGNLGYGLVKSETAQFGKLIRDAGIRAD